MRETELTIEGMTCEHCRERVEKALGALPGVRSAEVDLDGGRARIVHQEDGVDEGVLEEAVEDAGYRARAG